MSGAPQPPAPAAPIRDRWSHLTPRTRNALIGTYPAVENVRIHGNPTVDLHANIVDRDSGVGNAWIPREAIGVNDANRRLLQRRVILPENWQGVRVFARGGQGTVSLYEVTDQNGNRRVKFLSFIFFSLEAGV